MSVFDGTWRPDPQRPGEDAPAEELVLANGTYECRSCDPPYRLPADGEPHRVEGQGSFDALAVTVVDARTVRRVASLDGEVVLDAVTVVSPFGHTKRETQRRFASEPIPVEFAVTSRRIGQRSSGAHALSGRWQRTEADLPNHEEDTVYRVADGVLTMRDGFGRTFEAPLDGTRVPYVGDARFTGVTIREIDDHTIEELDWNGEEVALTARWRVDADGRTMHVRFEHASGLVQEQVGHRLD